MDALRALPEVLHVGGSHFVPFDSASRADAPLPSESDPSRTVIYGRYETIGLDFAKTLGIPLIDGQEPSPEDLASIKNAPAVQLALVNETLARHLARFGSPVGQIVAVTRGRRYRVTGVMADARIERLDRPPAPTVFGFLPPPAAVGTVFVRLRPGVLPSQTSIQTTLNRIWGSIAPRPEPVTAAVRRASGDYRARTFVLGMICLLTLPLTLIGAAGAITYATRQRTRELAIELAIGAEPRHIERRIVRQALSGAAVALVIGVGAGALLGRTMSAALYGVGAIDPAAGVVCSVVILLSVCIGAWIPARSAGRINTAVALRDT
jgi:putative ABC transport system permease protein